MLTSRKSRFAIAALFCAALMLGLAASAFADINSTWFNYDMDSAGQSPMAGSRHYPDGTHAHWSNQPWVLSNVEAWNQVYDVAEDTYTDVQVDPVWFKVRGGSESLYTSPITFSAEGTFTPEFRAIDSSGFPMTDEDCTYGVDKTIPTVSSDAKPVYDASAKISVSATDALSGAQYIFFSLDGASDYTTEAVDTAGYSVDITAGVGTHSLRFLAVDYAGNLSAFKTADFAVNPTGYVPVLSNPKVKIAKKRKVTFSGNVTAAASAATVKLAVERKVGKKWKKFSSIYVTVPQYAGSYTISKKSFKAGTFRVRASEGTGSSAKTTTFKVK